MTLEEIKNAVLQGKIVHWETPAYKVKYWPNSCVCCSGTKEEKKQIQPQGCTAFKVVCSFNNYAVGLTMKDGITMTAKEESYFLSN